MTLRPGLIFAIILPLLAGCDQLGIETPAQEMARFEAEGKAIGGSCRQSGRALEDCYQINPKAPKAAIFEGWREMDVYMRENKIEEVKPDFPMQPPAPKRRSFETPEEPLQLPPPVITSPPVATEGKPESATPAPAAPATAPEPASLPPAAAPVPSPALPATPPTSPLRKS